MIANTIMLPFKVGHKFLRIPALAGLTLVFLMLTHPAKVPALMLVLPFLAIFICVYWAALGGIHFFQPNNAEVSTARRIFRPRLLAAVIAGFPVLLLVLQSIMELNQQDVILAFGIFVLAYVFVSKGLVSQGTSPERQ